jgi:hypothetical protein
MLIRAVVHARLLGLRLLSLDARVVVANADPPARGLDAVAGLEPSATPLARPGRSDQSIASARELLAQGAEALATTRKSGRVRGAER